MSSAAPHSIGVRVPWLRDASGRFDAGAVAFGARGIDAIARGPAGVRRLRRRCSSWHELDGAALLPGLVDAHAHLELSAFAGRVPRGRSFVDWIRALLRERSQVPRSELERATRAAADGLVATGTTLVGDIASSDVARVALGSHRLRLRIYREVLDAGDPARTQGAIDLASRAPARHGRHHDGLSPHAPYTVSRELWSALGTLARRRRAHVAIHWAETAAEDAWLARGTGPFARLLESSPRTSGLDLIEAAGLLGPRTLLVHANTATPQERERIATAGAGVVHCPGAHAFFGRPPFDAQAWLDRGVPLALGTDSLAGNDALDLRREMALFARAHPGIRPGVVLDLATSGGAAVLGLAGRAGVLAPGAWSDLAAFRVEGRSRRAVERELVEGLPDVAQVWIGGRAVGVRGLC